VCHAGYLSSLICLRGRGLALSSLVGLGLTLFVVPLVVRRIEREEEMLAAESCQGYERCWQQVRWRLIPYVFD
jgi:protein-S-isoprenylcysteine O-methyltransferase Ste14